MAGCRAQANFPGAHAERLAAMGPEPSEKGESDRREIRAVKPVVRLEGLSVMKRQQNDRCGEEYRGKHHRIVKKGRQAAQQAGRIAVRSHRDESIERFICAEKWIRRLKRNACARFLHKS